MWNRFWFFFTLYCKVGIKKPFTLFTNRTIQPNGHLFTYEYHLERAEQADIDFKSHGFGDLVTVTQRDVCKDGFNPENKVSAGKMLIIYYLTTSFLGFTCTLGSD